VLESVAEERADAVPTDVNSTDEAEAVTVVPATESKLHFPEKMPEPTLQHTIALVPLKVVTVIAVGVPPVTKSTDVPGLSACELVELRTLQVPLVLAASA
jgi:hypothetical protein